MIILDTVHAIGVRLTATEGILQIVNLLKEKDEKKSPF